MSGLIEWVGRKIALFLSREKGEETRRSPVDVETLRRILLPCDVILVEGGQKISGGIKYLTQSTWSHSMIYIGDRLGRFDDSGEPLDLIETLLVEGSVATPLSAYARYNMRICRPVGLSGADRNKVLDFMIAHLGTSYDLKHIFDLARWLLPTPPILPRFRRRMIALGSREPTRAICSSLIAQAFQSVNYPILPEIDHDDHFKSVHSSGYSAEEIYRVRHHSLFVPRDFDLSPYFRIIKPTLETSFDYKRMRWAADDSDGENCG